MTPIFSKSPQKAHLIFTHLFSVLLLSGCATYNEHFDCEPRNGVGCKSLSDVNRMVDEGKLPLEKEEEEKKKLESFLPRTILQKRMRMWVSGYTDEEGIAHEAAWVHIPLQQAV